MSENSNQIATSRDFREPAVRIPRWLQVAIFLACLTAVPFAVVLINIRSWQAKVDEKNRVLENAAGSERKKYLNEFVSGLNSAIIVDSAIESGGWSSKWETLTKANSLGRELASTFRDLEKAHSQIERRRALADYLATPEARTEADRLQIPGDMLPLAAVELRSLGNE
jgi:hypothetical protein